MVMNMCGRGDKDIFTVAEHLGSDRCDHAASTGASPRSQASRPRRRSSPSSPPATPITPPRSRSSQACPAAGADVIELGMPFTDPMADGPAIQAAGLRALKAGQTMDKTLAMVRAFRKSDDRTPIVLMGYYNPI